MILLKDTSVLYSRLVDGKQVTLAPEMMYALGVASALKKQLFGLNTVVTSLLDGVHNPGSLHPKGFAGDLRDNDLTPVEQLSWFQATKDELEPMGFDVIHEQLGSTPETTAFHLHIEFDPRGRTFWHAL